MVETGENRGKVGGPRRIQGSGTGTAAHNELAPNPFALPPSGSFTRLDSGFVNHNPKSSFVSRLRRVAALWGKRTTDDTGRPGSRLHNDSHHETVTRIEAPRITAPRAQWGPWEVARHDPSAKRGGRQPAAAAGAVRGPPPAGVRRAGAHRLQARRGSGGGRGHRAPGPVRHRRDHR